MQRCFVQSSAVLDTLCTRWRDPTDVQRQTSPRIDDPTETTQERGASERVREGGREGGREANGAKFDTWGRKRLPTTSLAYPYIYIYIIENLAHLAHPPKF